MTICSVLLSIKMWCSRCWVCRSTFRHPTLQTDCSLLHEATSHLWKTEVNEKRTQSFGILGTELKWALEQSACSLCAFKWHLKQKKSQIMLEDNALKCINRLIHNGQRFPADFAAQRRIQCPWDRRSFLWNCKTVLPSLTPFFLRNSDKDGKFVFTLAPCSNHSFPFMQNVCFSQDIKECLFMSISSEVSWKPFLYILFIIAGAQTYQVSKFMYYSLRFYFFSNGNWFECK